MKQGWSTWFYSDVPEDAPYPDGYGKLETFQRLLLVRSWCLDRSIQMARRFIAETMGQQFADPVVTNLQELLEDSRPATPLTCFLSMGSDPTENIERLAKKLGLACGAISMGQGQEVPAQRLLTASMTAGKWVLLQNCHLGLNFMDKLFELVR